MKCPFVLSNDPMPTRQGEIGTVLLSPFEDGHYSNQEKVEVTHRKLLGKYCSLCYSISCGLWCWWSPSHGSSVG